MRVWDVGGWDGGWGGKSEESGNGGDLGGTTRVALAKGLIPYYGMQACYFRDFFHEKKDPKNKSPPFS